MQSTAEPVLPRQAPMVNLDELRRTAAEKDRTDRRLLELIHSARDDGASLRAIADAAGLSFQRIHQICKIPLVEEPLTA